MADIAVLDWRLLSPEARLIERLGPEHRVRDATRLDGPALEAALSGTRVLLTAMAPVTARMLDAAPEAGLIAKPGAGLDNIDLDAARKRGVLVCNAPGTRGEAVAEYALFALLYLARQAWRPVEQWAGRPVGVDLAGRTLGLVGLGDIGARLAVMGSAMGMTVVAATPSRRNHSPVPVTFLDVPDLLSTADAVVLCMPLSPATTGMIDRRALLRMKPDAILINVARGACVVTTDLATVMRSGHLLGAALDVTDPEPLPDDHPLRQLPNVLVTPHLAGRTPRAQERAITAMVANVQAFLAGATPPNAVDLG